MPVSDPSRPTMELPTDKELVLRVIPLPADVNANFSLSGTASLTRDLRPASATAVSQWSLAGKIAWGAAA